MISFCNKLSRQAGIEEVLFFSVSGDLLHAVLPAGTRNSLDRSLLLHEIIRDFSGAQLELIFSSGCWYICQMGIGHLAAAISDLALLPRVRGACDAARKQMNSETMQRKVLLKMLDEADLENLPQLIQAMEPLADQQVAGKLVELLRTQYPSPLREQLQVAICRTLGACASAEALLALRRFLKEAEGQGNSAGAALLVAQVAIAQLELDLDSDELAEDALPPPEPGEAESRNNTSPVTALSKGPVLDEQVAALAAAGNKGEAVSRLLQEIERAASTRDFARAEALREWLLQLDPMAIRETIQAAEIIEDAKKASLSGELLNTWQELIQTLGKDEFSALYHVTRARQYGAGEDIVKPGEFISSLFLVNSGQVQLYGRTAERDVPIKVVGPGEILGTDCFFEVSVWTIGLRSNGAELAMLDWPALLSLKHSYPALQSRLMDFCSRFVNSNRLFQDARRSRRRYERKPVRGRTAVNLLDDHGRPTGTMIKGDLLNISRGGVAFGVRFSRRKNAVVFLGKKIQLGLLSDPGQAGLARTGKVMAVRCHDFVGNDYSLHVEFDQELSPSEMQRVVSRTG